MILQWVQEVWKDRDAWEHWIIDNYGLEETRCEWNLEVPKLYMEDKDVRGVKSHQLRQKLIQVEMEMDGVGGKDEREKHEVKRSAWNHTREILMQYCTEILHRTGSITNPI